MMPYVNDAPRKFANCIAKSAFIAGRQRVMLFAAEDISCGTELRYDYGGDDLPWRKVKQTLKTSMDNNNVSTV
jgi:SET domain-containing protein